MFLLSPLGGRMQAPILVGELEVTEPVAGIQLPPRADGAAYRGVHLLVRMQRIPVGYVSLAPDELGGAAVARRVWAELGATVNRRRSRAGLPALAALPAGGIPAAP